MDEVSLALWMMNWGSWIECDGLYIQVGHSKSTGWSQRMLYKTSDSKSTKGRASCHTSSRDNMSGRWATGIRSPQLSAFLPSRVQPLKGISMIGYRMLALTDTSNSSQAQRPGIQCFTSYRGSLKSILICLSTPFQGWGPGHPADLSIYPCDHGLSNVDSQSSLAERSLPKRRLVSN